MPIGYTNQLRASGGYAASILDYKGVIPEGIKPEGVKPEGVESEAVKSESVKQGGKTGYHNIPPLLKGESLERWLRTFGTVGMDEEVSKIRTHFAKCFEERAVLYSQDSQEVPLINIGEMAECVEEVGILA